MLSKCDPPGTGTPLCIKVNSGHSQADKAGEERLLHVGVLLEGHVLDDGGELVVVPDHDPTLQPAVAVCWVLQGGRERLRESREETRERER